MRVENIEITMKIPLPEEGKPDCNGTVYPRDVIIRSLKNLKDLPICFRGEGEGSPKHVIGAVERYKLTDKDLIIYGNLFAGGTEERIGFTNLYEPILNYTAVGIGENEVI